MTADLDALPVKPGELIGGRYRIERLVGQGGMAVVFAARHEQLGDLVAIKMLLPRRQEAPEVRERFAREARAAVRIQSEHVCRVRDVGTLGDDGTPFMVMEYLEGEDLAALMARRRKLPAAEAILYVLQVCDALGEAHSLGIVHRDVKPANLFLAKTRGRPPRMKVLDFGISKVERHDRRRTETKEILGSPWYMAPEQMMRATSADARSDIWSLGVILYELVTGEVPFDGESMTEVIVKVLHDDPPRRGIPAELEPVIFKCLAKSPEDRYSTMQELALALGELAGADELAKVLSEQPPVVAAYEDEIGGDEVELLSTEDPPSVRRRPERTRDIEAEREHDLLAPTGSDEEPEREPSREPPPVSARVPGRALEVVAESSPPPEAEDVAQAEETGAAAAAAAKPATKREEADEDDEEQDEGDDTSDAAPASGPPSSPTPEPIVKPAAAAGDGGGSSISRYAALAVLVAGVGGAYLFLSRKPAAPPVDPLAATSVPAVSASATGADPSVDDDAGPISVTIVPNDPDIEIPSVEIISQDPPSPSAAPSPPRPRPATPAPQPGTAADPPPEAPPDDQAIAFDVARRNQTSLKAACYDGNPAVVTVTATVDGNGTVVNAAAVATDTHLAQCVEGQVKTWVFPAGPARSLRIPIRFRKN